MDALYSDNGKWGLIYVAIASAAATFVLAGKLGWEIGAGVIVILIVTALCVTALREMQARKAAERKLVQVELAPTASKSPASESIQALSQDAGPSHEASVTRSDADRNTTKDSGPGPKSSPPPDAQEAAGSGVQANGEDSDPETKAITAAIARDPDGVDAALEDYIQAADSEELQAERASLRLYLVVLAGRINAITALRSLADKHPGQSKIVERFAYALESIGETRGAADELRARRKYLSDGQLATEVLEARLRLALNEPEVALRLVRDALEGTSDGDDRAAALVQEGYALEALKRRVEAFASFEQSLVLTPANSDVRFHLAYEYSQDGFDTLAISHYETLASQGLKGSTDNNLAIAYRKLGMPILGVERFKRAGTDKSAWAHGNLAHLLINDGFISEALEHVRDGEAIELTNQRVASAAARVRTERDAEIAKKRDVSASGSQLREVFVRLDSRTPGEVPSGTFTSQNGHKLVLEGGPEALKGRLDDEWDVEVKASDTHLEFTLSKGPALLKTRANGRGIFRDRVLAAYFRDWPKAGLTTPFIGTPTNAAAGGSALPPSPTDQQS